MIPPSPGCEPRHRPGSPSRHLLLIALCGGVVLLPNLGGPDLWDEDEPKNATCAREMRDRNNLLVPTFNGQLRADKPILIYWLMQGAYALFGVNERAARLPSAMCAMLSCLTTYALAARLFGRRAALWSALVLPTMLLFVISGRAATTDAALTACTTAGVACLAMPAARFPRRCWWGGYACLGLAMLAKGPTGFLLPMTALLAWRSWVIWQGKAGRAARPGVVARALRAVLCAARWLMPLRGLLVSLAIAVPWYVAVGLATSGEWPRRFLLEHNVARYLQTLENHSGFPLFYLVCLVVGALPWSWPVVEGLCGAARPLLAGGPRRRGHALVVCWIAAYVLFFSFSSTKLPNYLLPCLPAVAMAAGCRLEAWCAGHGGRAGRNVAMFLAGGCATGMGLAVLSLVLLPMYQLPAEIAAGAGVVMASCFATALQGHRRGRTGFALGLAAAAAAALHLLLFAAAAQQIAGRQVAGRLVEKVPELAEPRTRVTALGHFRPSMVYYAGRPIEPLGNMAQLREQLAGDDPGLVITRRELLAEYGALPEGIDVLAELPMFLKPRHRVVVLGRARGRAPAAPAILAGHPARRE